MDDGNAVLARLREGMSRLVALKLWHLKAVQVDLDQPFRLVSGNYSPIYINCRQLISSPVFLDLFLAGARLVCQTEGIDAGIVAGGETAGIPFAAFLARGWGRPMVYVRKEKKGHGVGGLVEGRLTEGDDVLLVEDLITDGGSKLGFVEALRAAKAVVTDCLVVFDREQGGEAALAASDVRLHSLASLGLTLDIGLSAGVIDQEAEESVRAYLHDPQRWHQRHGLQYRE